MAGEEIIFGNGAVFDGRVFLPEGTCVRVSDGTITAVGPAREIAGPGGLTGVTVVDLDGGTLLPGFTDAHVHPVYAGDLPASSIAVLEQRYHLNESFLAQYWYWLDNALHGNLGISITLRENVFTLLASRVWTTAGLVLYASLIIAVLGIGIGIVAGLRPGVLDTGTLVTTAVSAAIPAFVAAIVLILLFAVRLRWFPALGNGTDFASNVWHFTLPAIALAISSLAIVARVTRASIREEGEREHVQTAVGRGIPARKVIRRHILRNAAIPITTVTGITIASLIAVAAVVEVAFSLNGLGAYLVQAAESKDLAVVQGISLVLVTAFVVVNLLVDVLYAILDPRVTLGSRPQ